jgi:hypothetical protein
MTKDSKFIIIAFLGVVLLLMGAVFLLAKTANNPNAEIPQTEVLGVEANPTDFNLGQVPIGGGIVTREYEVKNTTDKALKLRKIATSCMCTTAQIKVGDKESRFFGMEMMGDKNPFLDFKIPAGETAKIIVNFDPAAHGPQGVGPFDRVIWLSFESGMKELTFKGEVVN